MPRPDVSDERIPQILDAATRVFAEHGIDGASVAQVAEASGVSKATIYHYFESKEALVAALVDRLFAADEPGLERIVAWEAPAAERLRAYARELVTLLENNRLLWPIIAQVRARASLLEAADGAVREYYARYLDVFGTVIGEGVERGELRAGVRADDAALAFVSLVEGTLLIAEHTHAPIAETMERAVDVFVKGLTGR